MRVRALVVAVLGAVLVGAALSPARTAFAADEPLGGGIPAGTGQARAVQEAVERGDDAATKAAVEAAGGDPVGVAVRLLALRAAGASETPPRDGRELDAAAAVARLYADSPRAKGLAALVSTWAAWDVVALEREARFFASEAPKVGLAEAEAEMRARADDLAAASASPGALLLRDRHGAALLAAGRTAESIANRVEGIAEATALPWPMRTCLIRSSLAQPLLLLERWEAALENAERGLADAEACGMAMPHARFSRIKASALQNLGRLEAALEAATAARDEAKRIDHEGLLLAAESVRAEILSLVGRHADAIEESTHLLEAHRARGDFASSTRDLVAAATFESRAGRRSAAITLYERADAETARMKDATDARRLRATIGHNLGNLEVKAGDFDRGLERLRRAQSEREALGLREAAARTKGLVGSALSNSGRVEEGLAIHREILEAARRSPSPSVAARAAISVAADLAILDRHRESREAAEEALRRAGNATLEPDVPYLLRYWIAHALHGERNEEEAERTASSLTTPAAEATTPPGTLRDALVLHAKVLLALDRPNEAAIEARRALEAHRRLWDGLGEDEAVAARGRARELVDLALRAALARAGATDESERPAATDDAFAAIELGRALLLAEGLVNRAAILAARLPPGLSAEDTATRRRLDAARSAFTALSSGAPLDVAAARRTALEKAESERAIVAARVHREIRFGGELLSPRPATLLETRASLSTRGDDAAYVAYERAGERVVAIVVTGGGAGLVDLGPAAPIDSRASAWIDRLAAGANDDVLASRLYDALVRPLERHLGSASRLFIAPDAMRAGLPFAALLRTAEGASPERAVERFEVALVPSATAWAALERDAATSARGDGVLAIADPSPGEADGSLPALAHARDEAKGVVALYPADRSTLLAGAEATLARVRAALSGGGGRLAALHICGHALIDPDHPRRSAFVLAGGDRLRLDDVAEIGVAADVAVLSACETAVSTDLGGEGPVGFPRRLFLAGCPRVVVTAWSIGDASAGPVVRRFYEAMRREGLPVGAALRAAQRERIAAGDAPRAWAAFLLWGLPR